MPALWADAPGPLTVCLSFGVGRAHETLSTSGLSHFVEHLALSTLRDETYHYNGSVGSTVANFYASGTPEEVVRFISRVTVALTELPVDRFEVERQVLLAEEGSRPPNFVGEMSSLRFGPEGHGLTGFSELGLRRITPEEVRRWAAERFTRGAARLWITGPPPEGLEVPALPAGGLRPSPPVREVPSLGLPCFWANASHGCSLSVRGERSTALRMAITILGRRIEQILRHERGLIYSLAPAYDPLTATDVHAICAIDPLPDRTKEAALVFLDVVERFAEEGATDEEMARDLSDMVKAKEEPLAVPGFLDAKTINALLGTTFITDDEVMEEAKSTSGPEVGAALAAVSPSMLLQVPQDVDLTPRMSIAFVRPDPPVEGRSFKSKGVGTKNRVEAKVSEEGVSVDAGADRVRVLFEECVALVQDTDGSLILIGRDGQTIRMNPAEYSKGLELRSIIMQGIPSDRVIPIVPEARERASIEEMAARDLRRRWPVEDELEALGEQLREGEELLLLAEANKGASAGLLAVTDQRAISLRAGVRGRLKAEEMEKKDIQRIHVTRDKLVLKADDGRTLALKDIVPPGKAAEAARHLGLARPPERSFGWVDARPLVFALLALANALFVQGLATFLFAGVALGDIWLSGRLSSGLRSERYRLYVATALVAAVAVCIRLVS